MRDHDSERYSTGYSRSPYLDVGKFVWCKRKRCETRMILQKDEYENRYPESVVVVSLNDGTNRYAFCSRKCAANWLSSQAE